MSVHLVAEIPLHTGDLLKRDMQSYISAAQSVLLRRARGVRDGLRRQIKAAGFGDKLPKAVKHHVGRVGVAGGGIDLEARVTSKAVYKRAGGRVDLIAALIEGANIRPITGKWLAIPTAIVPPGTAGGGNPKRHKEPRDFPEGFFRFVESRGGRQGLLYRADVPRHQVQEPWFILVRSAVLRLRLTVDALMARARAGLSEEIDREWGKRLTRQATAVALRRAA